MALNYDPRIPIKTMVVSSCKADVDDNRAVPHDTPSTFTFKVDTAIPEFETIMLESVSIPNQFPVVEENGMYVTVTGSPEAVVPLEVGAPSTPVQWQTYLQTALQTVDANFTVAYDTFTHKITIAHSTTTFLLRFPNTVAGYKAARICGIPSQVGKEVYSPSNRTPTASLTPERTINISGDQWCAIRLAQIHNNNVNNGGSFAFHYAVPILAPYGYEIKVQRLTSFLQNTQKTASQSAGQTLTTTYFIQILDQYGRLATTVSDWTIILGWTTSGQTSNWRPPR